MAHASFADVLPLYWDEDGCPMVDLDVQGAACPFSVDTGCNFTTVSLRQVEAWGLTAQVVPLKEPRRGNVGFLEVTLGFCTSALKLHVVVADMEWNLLGCNVLADLCCIINLDPSRPSLTIRGPASVAWNAEVPTATIAVAGHPLQAIPDTGTSGFLLCHLAEVADLPLDFQDVPDDFCLTTTYGPQAVMFKAVDAPVRLSGRERRGTVLLCEKERAIVGMELLAGAVLRFDADGSFGLHFPGESLGSQRRR